MIFSKSSEQAPCSTWHTTAEAEAVLPCPQELPLQHLFMDAPGCSTVAVEPSDPQGVISRSRATRPPEILRTSRPREIQARICGRIVPVPP